MKKRTKQEKEQIGEIFIYEPTGEQTTLQSGDTALVKLGKGFVLISFYRKKLNSTDRLLFDNGGDNKWYVNGNKFVASDIILMLAKIYNLTPRIIKETKDYINYKFS